MPAVYTYQDYRTLLRDWADERKATSSGVYKYADLAKAIGVQPTYLSRVFRQDAHLNSDQVDMACLEFRFNEAESNYVQLLLEFQKSAIASRQERLKAKIKKAQEAARDTKNHLEAETVSSDQNLAYQEYFLEPFAPLVHVFLALPAYQAAPEQICQHLKISPAKLVGILQTLQKTGMISYDPISGRYTLLKDHLHLEKSSILNQTYQALGRAISQEHVSRSDREHKHQYAATFGADEETMRAIFDEFNSFMSRVESLVRKAPSKGVFQLNFDLFRWDTLSLENSKLSTTTESSKSKSASRESRPS